MTGQNFQIALRAFTRRSRFRPFLVELISGDRFRVGHPEALTMRGKVAMYVAPDKAVKLFDSESVCQLCDEPRSAPA
jgi:hypothetical protein